MNAGHYLKRIQIKRFKIDEFFHFTEANIKHMKALLFPLSFFSSLKPTSISDMSFPPFLTIKMESSIIYELLTCDTDTHKF